MADNTAKKDRKNQEKKKHTLGLSTKIFIALLLGAVCGVLIHYFMPAGYVRDTVITNGILYGLGNGFIRLMQMLVVPLVFCSLVCGSMAIGDTKTLGKVGIKTILFYLCTTALAICLALGVASLINPGVGMSIAAAEGTSEVATTSINFADTMLNMIPKNIFNSLASGDMLPVIVFAVFVGIMLAQLGNKASTVSNFFSQFNDIMMEMTMAIMKVAPIGVFCLIAKTLSIDTLHKKMGVSKQISSFTIPLGATVNMDGTSIMQGVAVIFIAQAYGIALTPSAIMTVILTATIASIGTAGVPSVGLVTLSMVLSSVGLPTEGIALIMGIDRILDMLRTAVNITGDAVCTTVVAKQQGMMDKDVFNAADVKAAES